MPTSVRLDLRTERLIRQLAFLYGGRPGTLGVIRLMREVLAHLALTGGMAVGDSLIQQVLGHGLAAKVSARLGEGVLNGLLAPGVWTGANLGTKKNGDFLENGYYVFAQAVKDQKKKSKQQQEQQPKQEAKPPAPTGGPDPVPPPSK